MLEKNADYIDELIGKQLAGEARSEEIAWIESWANEQPENRRHVDQCRIIFEQAVASKGLREYDTDAAWRKVQESLKGKNPKVVRIDQGNPNRWLMWRVAASIMVVLGVGFFAYQAMSPDRDAPVVLTTTSSVVTDTLPDGSGVVLNKETSLSYAFDEKEHAHRVKLAGEAYFSILHDEKKTFIIDIAGVYVRDIGTSFNVKAYPESNTVEVVVESGEVMFYTDTDSGVYLRANGKGIYDKTSKQFTIDQPETNVLAYKTKFFTFSNTSLGAVVEALNVVYDTKIVIADHLRNCHLTVSFRNEREEEIVAVIAETLGLTVTKTADGFTLEGPACIHE